MLSLENNLEPANLAIAAHDPLGLAPLPVDNRKRFLKFVLSKEKETLLPLSQVLEVMQILPESILPIPDMSSCILGVCVWKGETLWLVDLNTLVGYEPLYEQARLLETASVVVVQTQGKTLGLVVEKVSDIDLFDEDDILSGTGLYSPELEPFVLGYFSQQSSLVLDIASIFDAPELHAY